MGEDEMWLSLSFAMAMEATRVDPPTGGISPLAWVIISALALVCVTAIPALWYRGNKIQDRSDKMRDQMYEDLKECNQKKVDLEDEVLGLFKVIRLQMEHSKGGKKR